MYFYISIFVFFCSCNTVIVLIFCAHGGLATLIDAALLDEVFQVSLHATAACGNACSSIQIFGQFHSLRQLLCWRSTHSTLLLLLLHLIFMCLFLSVSCILVTRSSFNSSSSFFWQYGPAPSAFY